LNAGASGYEKGFIEYWVHWLIFHEAPSWVFTALYTGFAALIIVVWLAYPPVRHSRKNSDA
jgi:hypothetical protein